MKIAVVGAGIAGITAAYYLAKQGHKISVFEQETYAAMKTSYANGGQISASNSEVWNTWRNVYNGVRWLFQKQAPLLIRPSLELDKISWLSRFLYHTLAGHYTQNTIYTIQLALESRYYLEKLIFEEKIQFDYKKSGILHFYTDKTYLDRAGNAREIYETNSCQWEMLDSSQVLVREPALKYVGNLVGGAWTGEDAVGDIHMFCNELVKILKNKWQVEFCFDQNIESTLELTPEFDIVVLANGIGAQKLAKEIGDNLHIYPVKGYSITLYDNEFKNLPKVSLLDDKAKIVTSTLGNRLRVAGTAELAGVDYDVRRDRIEPLINWVKKNLPQVETKNYSQWACLRPMTPNMLPIFRQSTRNKNVYYHAGHGHLGWTISLATANRLAKQVENHEGQRVS